MSNLTVTLVRRLSLAAALAFAASAAQSACVVIGTCAAADRSTLLSDLTLTNGAVQKPGRNPPSRFYCPDLGLTATAVAGGRPPNSFELQFRDPNGREGGNVRAMLMRKSLSDGGASRVAQLYSTYSPTVATVRTPVAETWDLGRFAYFVMIELEAPTHPVEAHTVCLVAR